MQGLILAIAYVATIPIANFMIGHVGTVCVPQGPCLIPVASGVMAPSGVLMIGAALVLRDLVQRTSGAMVSLMCIGIGVAVSYLVSDPHIAMASGAAFLISEFTDFAVYTPLARKRFFLAVALSCVAGAAVDSVAFLWLAFGSLDHLLGQIIGKLYAVVAFSLWVLSRQYVRAPR